MGTSATDEEKSIDEDRSEKDNKKTKGKKSPKTGYNQRYVADLYIKAFLELPFLFSPRTFEKKLFVDPGE